MALSSCNSSIYDSPNNCPSSGADFDKDRRIPTNTLLIEGPYCAEETMCSIIIDAVWPCSDSPIDKDPSENASRIEFTVTLPLLTAIRISSTSESAFLEELLLGNNPGVISNDEGNSSFSLFSSSSSTKYTIFLFLLSSNFCILRGNHVRNLPIL